MKSPQTYEELKKKVDILEKEVVKYKKIEKALKAKEEKQKAILSSMDELLFVLDNDGKFIDYYQPSNKHLLYLPPDDFLGKSYRELFPEDIVLSTENAINLLKISGKLQQFEYSLTKVSCKFS